MTDDLQKFTIETIDKAIAEIARLRAELATVTAERDRLLARVGTYDRDGTLFCTACGTALGDTEGGW